MLSKTELMSHAGTSVAMDFVEAPSQLLENWTWNKESLNLFAKHYKTGEKIPKELVDKIRESRQFMAGWMFLRQLQFAFLDMAWYTTTDITDDVESCMANGHHGHR